jgi:hypothetical protein
VEAGWDNDTRSVTRPAQTRRVSDQRW